MTPTGQGSLSGLCVLDCSRFIAGPYCGMLLGDLGADVVKVERPQGGDEARSFALAIAGETLYVMVYTAEVADNPQLRHGGRIVNVDHPSAGSLPTEGPVIGPSESPAAIRRPAPRLGEHTDVVRLTRPAARAHRRPAGGRCGQVT